MAASAAPVEIDPYDLADPVDMLAKMPKNFFDQLVQITTYSALLI